MMVDMVVVAGHTVAANSLLMEMADRTVAAANKAAEAGKVDREMLAAKQLLRWIRSKLKMAMFL
jgi:hypothetical protein